MPADPDLLVALEEERDFLLRSLDDLEQELAAGDIDDDDYRTLHDGYTKRAAEVLRAIDGERDITAVPSRPPRWRRLVAAGVVVAMAVGAGLGVAASSGSRGPGDSVSGDIRESSIQKLSEAARLAQDGQYADALELYDEVLAGDPENVEALGERGLLLVTLSDAAGRAALREEGQRSIEAALALEPQSPRLLFYRGLAQRLAGDIEASEASFDAALEAGPPEPLREAIEAFRKSVGSDG